MSDRKYTPLEIAKRLEETLSCNCDLDNWEPTRSTGHSHVCRIHTGALGRYQRPYDYQDFPKMMEPSDE
jgi:hypothetical protein